MKDTVERLHERLVAACKPSSRKRSENHKTATTWLLYFEDINCRVIFDSEGNDDGDRPDIQVWFSQDDSTAAHLWVEAKQFGAFDSPAKTDKALSEVKGKIESCLRHNQSMPRDILVTDFERHFVWPIDSFIRSIERGDKEKGLLKSLGKPINAFKTSEKNEFANSLTWASERWEKLTAAKDSEDLSLDLDSLILELLDIATEYRATHLQRAVSLVSQNKKIQKLFKEWMECGGELTVQTVNSEIKDTNVGAEEAFACRPGHYVMVRCFVIKWFLDHGYLSPSDTATLWGCIQANSELLSWQKLLSPQGSTKAEQILREIMRSSDIYLWILESAPTSIWFRIKRAFARYSLVAEQTDVLGEFYQKYMQRYAKKSQMLLGQFYTPHRLSRAMWRLAGEVMRTNGISLSDKSCLVIDPCVGTGTFMTQGLRLLLDGAWGNTKKSYPGEILKALTERFTGFEINPLSRGVALVNCTTELLAHSSDGCATFSSKPRIFETNAYDVPDPAQQELFKKKLSGDDGDDFYAWRKEVIEASEAKAKDQYRVVIGNPPWRNPSPACKNKNISRLLREEIMPWAWEYQGVKLSSIKGCNHGIRDDYMFFFGLGMRLLKERGLLVYVTNESWLAAPTYTMFRRYLLDNFKIHSVIRVGPVFEGVKERAAVVLFEKVPTEKAGRKQKIKYIDWSDLSNSNWSMAWINERLDRIINGQIKRSDYSDVSPSGPNCTIRPAAATAYSPDLEGCIAIEELFTEVCTGAQAGCGPVFIHSDEEVLDRRIKLLFQRKHAELADEIAPFVRGGKEKANGLIARIQDAISSTKAKYSRKGFKTMWVHLSGGTSSAPAKKGHCYFDPQLWLFPRTDRVEVGESTIWDVKPKLVFRDMYDPDDKLVMAAVDEEGVIIDNHFFNGGVYVASVVDAKSNSLLSAKGKALRSKFKSDEQFLYYLAAILNSPQVVAWSKVNPLERVFIPTEIDEKVAQRVAELEAKRRPIWERQSQPDAESSAAKEASGTLDKLIGSLELAEAPAQNEQEEMLASAKKAKAERTAAKKAVGEKTRKRKTT